MITASVYQKKTDKLLAHQWDGTDQLPEWVQPFVKTRSVFFQDIDDPEKRRLKVILHGGRLANAYVGDWLVCNALGLIYPISAASFETYYELVQIVTKPDDA